MAEGCCVSLACNRGIRTILYPDVQGKGSKVGQGYKFSSVASRFKRQLADLMDALHRMEPHYIRCIKPNSRNRCARMHPQLRNRQMVMQTAICRLKCSRMQQHSSAARLAVLYPDRLLYMMWPLPAAPSAAGRWHHCSDGRFPPLRCCQPLC